MAGSEDVHLGKAHTKKREKKKKKHSSLNFMNMNNFLVAQQGAYGVLTNS